MIEVDGVAHRVSRDEGGVLRSPAPGAGGGVAGRGRRPGRGRCPVLVLESMKMETVLRAPFAARVRELLVMTGSQVETGAPLVRLEPVEDDADGRRQPSPTRTGPALDLPPAAVAARRRSERAARGRADVAAMLMGYDVDPREDGAVIADYLAARDELVAAGGDVVADEIELLGLFADFAELSRNRPAGEDLHTELRVHSSKEHFHAYLQSLDVERGGLPDQFRDRLARVLAHYGVTDWDRTPQLEEAVFRIFLAQQRSAPDVLLATELLQRWIAEPPPSEELAGPARDLLERLVRSTQLRFPVVGDLARSTRFRWFDQPLVDAERSSVLAGVRDEVAALAADPDAPDRTERMEALAAIPEQIVRFLAERLENGVPSRSRCSRCWSAATTASTTCTTCARCCAAGRTFAVADYTLDDRPTRLVSTVGTIAELTDPGSALTAAVGDEVAARTPGSRGGASTSTCTGPTSRRRRSRPPRSSPASSARCPSPTTYAGSRSRSAPAGTGRSTTSPTAPLADDGVVEDDLVRGVHPMVGRRLDLWRLRDFHVTRIDAPEDVLLYECVARENPADRRLVALAQVRQLAVVRDEEGRVIGLPHAERAVENCLEAIRRVRASRGAAGSKLDTNHVWVQVWPIVEADVEQLTALQGKITPLTDGAGIEEVLAQGRVIGPDGSTRRSRSGSTPGPAPASRRPSRLRRPNALKPLDEYAGKVVRARRRGLVYPYELAGVLNLVLCGDPTKALGAVSEPDCLVRCRTFSGARIKRRWWHARRGGSSSQAAVPGALASRYFRVPAFARFEATLSRLENHPRSPPAPRTALVHADARTVCVRPWSCCWDQHPCLIQAAGERYPTHLDDAEAYVESEMSFQRRQRRR